MSARFTNGTKGECFAACATVLVLVLAVTNALAAAPALVWSDEFNQPNGSAPDANNWGYDLGRGHPVGWGNDELETYSNARENAEILGDAEAIDGHALVIRAQQSGSTYTSARLQTSGKRTFTYGRLEARLKMPRGRGLWPAFWALGSNVGTVGWPACGEIDAMEWVGPALGNGTILGSLHAVGYSGTNPLSARYSLPAPETFSDAYHVFAVDRYPDRIVFSVDGAVYEDRQKNTIPAGAQWPFDQPFYIILNLAVGGNWPGLPDASTVFPQEYRIDYVRLYDLPETPPTGLVYPPAGPTAVEVNNANSGRIALTWTAPADTFGAPVTGYELQRATNPAFTENLLARIIPAITQFTDKGLLAGRTSYYRLAAITANGMSDFTSTATAELTLRDAGADRGTRLANVSTRAYVATGEHVAIVGFAVAGTETRRLLVRGIGPALRAYDVNDPLADPRLTLYDLDSGGAIATDDDWASDGNADVVRSSAVSAGAFALDEGSTDAAVVVDLPPGVYTAVIEGNHGTTGTALVETYEVPAAAP